MKLFCMDMNKNTLLAAICLSLTACSGAPSVPDEPTVNIPPTAQAGEAQTVDEQTTVTLQGAGQDTDGSIVGYQWEQMAGTAVTLLAQDASQTTFVAPQLTESEVLEFKLTVTDNKGATGTSNVAVTVMPVNASPSVTTAENVEVLWGSEVQLTAQGVDSDGEIVSYQWEQVSGTQLTISGADSASASVTLPEGTGPNEDFSFKVTVTDNEGGQSSDTMDVTGARFVLQALNGTSFQAGDEASWQILGYDNTQQWIRWETAQASGVEFSYEDGTVGRFVAPHFAQDKTIDFEVVITNIATREEIGRISASFEVVKSEDMAVEYSISQFEKLSGSSPSFEFAEFADFNGDGQIDMVQSNSWELAYYQGNGGSYSKTISLLEDTLAIDHMTVVDVDSDGLKDIAVSYRLSFVEDGNTIQWYKNLGDGTFSQANLIDNSAGLDAMLTFADLNKDGHKDLLVLEKSDGTAVLSIYRQMANMAFDAPVRLDNNADSPFGWAKNADSKINVTDFNNDGHMDIVYWPFSSGVQLRAYYYQGASDLNNFVKHDELLENSPLSFSSDLMSGVEALDINNDGWMDFVGTYQSTFDFSYSISTSTLLYINDGQGRLVSQSLNTSGGVGDSQLVDFDNDGDKDVVYYMGGFGAYSACASCPPNYTAGRLAWLENDNSGAFAEARILAYPEGVDSTIRVFDYESDGDMDIVGFSAFRETLSLYKNTLK